MNPWWRENMLPDNLPGFRRAAWQEVRDWVSDPPFRMAVLVVGPRRVGKSTLMMQQIRQLLEDGVNPRKILYADFEDPVLKLAGFRRVLKSWKEISSPAEGREHLFLDEIQLVDDWGSRIKRQVDSQPNRQIMFSASAFPLSFKNRQSGVGRWHEVFMGPMSFFEFLRFRQAGPAIPQVDSLAELFTWRRPRFAELKSEAAACMDMFRDYIVRGGYPELADMADLQSLRRFARNELARRTLTRDISDEYSGNSHFHLQAVFRHLCKNNGGALDRRELAKSCGLSPASAKQHLEALLSTQHASRLAGTIQGRGMFNARHRMYVSDHAVALAVTEGGADALLRRDAAWNAVRCMAFGHIDQLRKNSLAPMCYWKDASGRHEVDFVLMGIDEPVPVAVRRGKESGSQPDLRGLAGLHAHRGFSRGYVVTDSADDIGPAETIGHSSKPEGRIMKVPALLFCYWLGAHSDQLETRL